MPEALNHQSTKVQHKAAQLFNNEAKLAESRLDLREVALLVDNESMMDLFRNKKFVSDIKKVKSGDDDN